jgi:hypothetical protein
VNFSSTFLPHAMIPLACAGAIAAGLLAQDTSKTSPPPPPKAAKPAPAKLVIPKDAVETSPGLFRWTDKDGKVWVYRRSPFGVSRWPAASDSRYDKQDAPEDHVTAVEQGDSIRFERSTPLGQRTWVRKKSDLTAEEKAIWERQQKTGSASRSAEKE